MNTHLEPFKIGQILKTIVPYTNEKQDDVYILTGQQKTNDDLQVVSLNELQRNIENPELAEKKLIPSKNLKVIADTLEQYVSTFNK